MSDFENSDPKELSKKEEDKVSKRTYTKIEKEKLFDIEENMMMSMLHNMKRSDTIEQAKYFCESIGLENIPEKRLISIYTSARNKLFDYRLENIAQEKEKFIKRIYRVGCKAEAKGDFANAFKCYDRIADIAGVNKENDESKVILNFIPAKKVEDKASKFLGKVEEKKDDND